MRHLYGTRLLERGVPMTVVEEALGHSTVTATERYARASTPLVRRELAKAHRVSNWLQKR
jgi:site-specific recombinase XerD